VRAIDMKRFFLRIIAFSSPIILWMIIEFIILPADFFTFRGWEAFTVKSTRWLRGPYYPNLHMTKHELGDLIRDRKHSVPKDVLWITDDYGFREAKHRNPPFDMVIIGDSNVGGSKLSQNEIITEVIEQKSDLSSYNYMLRHSIREYLADSRFIAHPPRLVVFAVTERQILEKFQFKSEDDSPWREEIKAWAYNHDLIKRNLQTTSVLSDRISKRPSVQYLLSRLRKSGYYDCLAATDSSMFFINTPRPPDSTVDVCLSQLLKLKAELEKSGSSLIFMPVPDKQSIYFEKLKQDSADYPYLPRLLQLCRQNHLEVVDLYSEYRKQFIQKGRILYYTDDTHWNAEGVRVAADVLLSTIAKHDSCGLSL
jgi:alginate O-acetyltransferase complex protein AlgJ